MTIGVLALQGAFERHAQALARAGIASRQIRRTAELAQVEALIIPGGESTTIGKLMTTYGFFAAIREFGREHPVFGTCAGMILLGKQVTRGYPNQPLLGMMDLVVERNAYGRQVDSFEADLEVPVLGPPAFRGVFIRAPRVVSVGRGVEVLAEQAGAPVLVRQGRLLAAAFHPEMTADTRLHRYFASLAG